MKRTRIQTPADRVLRLWDLHCLEVHGRTSSEWYRQTRALGGCSDCRVFDYSWSESLAYPERYPAVMA